MKTYLISFIVACAVVAGAVIYLNRQKAPPAPAPVAEPASAQTAQPSSPENISPPKPPPAAPAITASEPASVAVATPAAEATNSAASSTNSIAKAVDALLSAKDGAQKHALFQQLLQAGQLEQVIAELQQRAESNPTDPEIRTTLGEAQLNQIRALHESGADNDQIGILAMQADLNFNAALKIDPQNWEAQFVKASSMYYWPADPTRDADVVQRLSKLIDQQEGMSPQPEFAQSYVVLGNEYEKIGKHDEALATWQLGAQKFPADPTLQKKIGGQ